MTLTLVHDDGGRHTAGYADGIGDCATRAIAIALDRPYQLVHDELARRGRDSPSVRVHHDTWTGYLRALDWRPTAAVHTPPRLRAEDLPAGRLIVELTAHLTAVIDGAVHDVIDPKIGTARVVSIWTGPTNADPLDPPTARLF